MTDGLGLKPLAQDQAWRTLLKLAEQLPQGVILVGPAGVGKRRAARALYQWLHCGGDAGARTGDEDRPCGRCAPCRKIAGDLHADFIEIGPKGETIAVDDLREMKKSLYFRPVEGKVRFVLIDQAHKLNAASANTLLKTLEEPPTHTRFFLVTHERGLLLPTIVSRCQFVHFSPLDQETLKLLLARLQIEIPAPLLPLCLDLLAGGLERAALFADEKVLSFLDSTRQSLAGSRNLWSQVVALGDQLAAQSESSAGQNWKLELLLDLLVLRGREQALAASRRGAPAQARLPMQAAYLRRRLDRHANRKLIALAAAKLALEEPR